MPPKAKKAGASKGKQKSVKEPDRPSWLSEEAWKASKDVPKLVEKLRGVAEKAPQGVSRAQASSHVYRLQQGPCPFRNIENYCNHDICTEARPMHL